MSQSSYEEQVLHPVKDYKIQNLDLVTSVQKMMSVKEKIDSMECRLAPDIKELFEKIYTKMEELASPANIFACKTVDNGWARARVLSARHAKVSLLLGDLG